MKIKEIYEKNKIRRFCDITKIKKENFILKSSPIDTLKENIIVMAAIFVLIIGFLLVNFQMQTFLISIALIVILILMFIYGNMSKITCEKNSIIFEQGFQKNIIDHSKLKNVFIGRATDFFIFIPLYSYKLVLRYEDNFNFLREIEIPLLCIKKEQLCEFIENFEIKEEIVERYVSYDRRKKFGKIFLTVISIIIAVIVVFYLTKNNIVTFKI